MAGESVVGSSTSVIATSVVLGGWSHPAPPALRSPWGWLGLVRRCTYALHTAADGCTRGARPVAWRGAVRRCAPGALWIVDWAIAVGFTAAVVLITHKIEGQRRLGPRSSTGSATRASSSPGCPLGFRRRAPLTVLAVTTVATSSTRASTSPADRSTSARSSRCTRSAPPIPAGSGASTSGSRPAASARPGSSTTRDAGTTLVPRRLLHVGHRGRVHRRRGPLPPGVPPRLGGTGQVPGGVPRGGVAPARRRGAAAHRPGPARRRRPQPRLDQHPGRRGRARRRGPSGPGRGRARRDQDREQGRARRAPADPRRAAVGW